MPQLWGLYLVLTSTRARLHAAGQPGTQNISRSLVIEGVMCDAASANDFFGQVSTQYPQQIQRKRSMAHFLRARFTTRAPVGHFLAQTVQKTQLSLENVKPPLEPCIEIIGANGY